MFDVFQKGKTIYHVDRVLRETGDIVENGFHEIYVNAAIDDRSDIAGLMKVLSSPEVLEDERFPIVCQQIKHFKEGRGRNAMCKLVEEFAEAYYVERLEEHAREQALKMLKKNMSKKDIGEYTGLSLEEIDELEKEKLVKN